MNQRQKILKENWDVAKIHMSAVKEVIKENLPLLIGLDTASPQKDMEEATDLILVVKGGDIAVRIRKKEVFKEYQDWTVRSIVMWANRTEIDKLRDGFGDWYFYGWSKDNKGRLKHWILIDLKKVRDCGLLDTARNDIPNGDGTYFRAYSANELSKANCLISHSEFLGVRTF